MSYETLRIIWWLLIGVLLGFFAVMDGFDLGTAVLLPFVAKNDMERRIVINTVGPVWEGNQVWFIIGGGAIFAAWPMLYAASFSGFYLAMILVLFTLILRAAGFKFRSKIESADLAQHLGLGLVCGRPCAVARVRRRIRQSVRGRSVRIRWRSAHAIRYHADRSPQSLRAARRTREPRDDGPAWRMLAQSQDDGADQPACAIDRASRRIGIHRAFRAGGLRGSRGCPAS